VDALDLNSLTTHQDTNPESIRGASSLPQTHSGNANAGEDETSSDAQAMPALRTPGANHGTTTPGTHANQETMSTLTTYHRWLISAFHKEFSLRKVKPSITSTLANLVNQNGSRADWPHSLSPRRSMTPKRNKQKLMPVDNSS
jgi:hypothetical protein